MLQTEHPLQNTTHGKAAEFTDTEYADKGN